VIGLQSAACDRPLASDRAFEFSIPGGAGAPGAARNGVAGRLNGTLDDALLDTLRLLVSEVATNCVQHAHADARSRIDIAVSRPPGAVRVELSTEGAPFERPPGNPQEPPASEAHGRGLLIVDSLARAWGAGPDVANHVWFELAVAEAG
jgi:Histidine kinase-like ATPase domain